MTRVDAAGGLASRTPFYGGIPCSRCTPLVVLNDWWRIAFFIVGLAMFAVFGVLRSNNRFKPTVHSLSSRPTA